MIAVLLGIATISHRICHPTRSSIQLRSSHCHRLIDLSGVLLRTLNVPLALAVLATLSLVVLRVLFPIVESVENGADAFL